MNTNARKTAVVLSVFVFALGLSACNTIKGVGKDTQKAGEKIEAEADQHIDNDDNDRP